MATGTCGLCELTKDLQDSHFLPKAFYKLLLKLSKEDGQQNPNPVVLNEKVALKTSSQVKDYLLCKDCEDLFSSGREKWILEHCWHSSCDFPLRDALQKGKPALKVSGDEMYEGSAVLKSSVISQLIYFAASIFWRGAAHQWG